MPPGREHARHFGKPLRGIGHEEDHQRHDGDVEACIRERQRHRVALPELREPRSGPGARECELSFRGIDALGPSAGAQRSTIRSEKAPLPQPISTQRNPGFGASQSRKMSPASRLHGAHVPLVGGAVVEAELVRGPWAFLGSEINGLPPAYRLAY